MAGRLRPLSIDVDSAREMLDQKTNDWIVDLAAIAHKDGVKVPRAEVFAYSAAYIDRHLWAEPAASKRLDAHLRLNAHVGLARLRRTDAYNPTKNRNDAVDLDVLTFLALPVAVCTGDLRLQRLVRSTGTWQACWVLTPSELADHMRQGRMSLDWPRE